MVRKIFNKAISVLTTTLLAFTTIASAIPVTTYAADATVKSKHELKSGADTVGAGFGTFNFDSKVSGVTFTHSKNLTKASKSDWIWGKQDEGGDSAANIKRLGNAWICNLKAGTDYWVKYNGISKKGTTKKYDVKVVFNNPKGEINNAYGKDIAIFDGQLGAVRFRGYKHLDCTLYVYEHGTSNLIAGNDDKLHFRFIDIDCNQAVEVLTPGRVNWYYLKSKVEWMGKAKCSKFGATYGNTFQADSENVADDDAIQIDTSRDDVSQKDKDAYKRAVKSTAALGFTPPSGSSATFKVRYYAGGIDKDGGTGTQRNGVFFSFDGGLDLSDEPEDAQLYIDKTTPKYSYKVGDTFDYTIAVKNITKESKAITAENVVISDSIPSELKVNSVSTSQGTATHSGNAITAAIGNLAQDATATVKVNVTALEAGNGQELYNAAKAEADNAPTVRDDAKVSVNSADVQVDKVVDKYEYAVGEKANFTVKVKNTKGIAENLTVSDELPSGMKLDYDSVKISGVPASVAVRIHGPADTPNDLMDTNERGLTETKTITATKSKSGDNGWAYKINYLPANSTATITFSATATEAGNGKEQQNVVTATGDNFSKAEDDAEYYVNTPDLSLSKKYVNPYKDEKKDNRCDNEFRVFEKETGYEKVQYEVLAKNTAPAGTVAKDVVISDVTLPEGLALNYDSIKISEISDNGTKTFSKASGGNGNTIKYHVAGTADETNKLNPEHYNETQDKTPVITVEKKGNGFVVKDSLMAGGASLKIEYNANALENDKVDVNGSEIRNEATATASNLAKVDGKVPTIKADTTVYINSPRLKIEKQADSGDYEVGDNVSYTINVVNTHKGTIARNLVYTDELKTKGVQILTGTIALYDTDGYELREGGTLAGEVDYKKHAKVDGFTLTTRKHLVVDGNYDKYDLAQGKNPEVQGSWNPSYVNTKKETLMSIKYDMKITDKALAGKDILNVATAVSDEALKVTTDETVKPKGPEPTPEKSVDRTNPAVGEDVTFTLRFTNNNAGTVAKDVKIKDFMNESNMVKIREDSLKVTLDNKDITKDCKITYNDSKDGFEIETGKDLAQSQAIVVSYKAEVLLTAAGKDLVNTTGVNCTNNPEWKYAEAPFSPEDPTPELKIEKKSDKTNYSVGDTGHYTVKVTQTADNATARNVVIEDAFDNKKAILDTKTIKLTDSKGKDITKEVTIEGTQSGYKIETGKNLAQNEFFTVTYDVLFTDQTLGGEEVTNVAKTHADNVPEKTTTVTVKIEKPELEVTKTSDKKVYSFEDTAHYTVKTEEVKENATAYNVVIDDQLQVSGAKVLAETIKISDKDGKDFTDKCEIECKGTGYTIKTKRDLTKGETFTVNYDVVFEDRSLIDNYVPNVVKVTADNASAQTENEVTPKTVKTEDGAEYQILKSCQPASGSVVNVGDEIDYTITVSNTGKKDLKDVKIKDAIPTHTQYVSGGTLTKADDKDTVVFKVDEIKAGAKADVTFKVKVIDEGLCEIVNVGYVKASTDGGALAPSDSSEKKDDSTSTESKDENSSSEATTESKDDNTTESTTPSGDATDKSDSDDGASEKKDDGWADATTGVELDTTTAAKDETTSSEATTLDKDETSSEATTSSEDVTTSDGSHNGTSESTDKSDFKDETSTSKDDTIATDKSDSKDDSNGSLVDQIKDTISNIKDNVTGNDPEFSGDDFYATNQVVHFVPYRVQVIAPELAIGKTSDKKEYTVGETGHYNVEVVQTKDDAVAKNIHVVDKLDKAGAEIQKDSIKVYDGEGKLVTGDCTIKCDGQSYDIQSKVALAKGQTMKIQYDVLFKSSDLSGQKVLNTAKAQASNQKNPEDWVEDNNEVSLDKPKLAIKKSSNRVTFKPEETGKYTITVTNKSTTATAKNVVVKDNFNKDGVKIQKSSIKIENDGKVVKGAEISCKGNSFVIKTKQDLAPNADMVITYKAKFSKKGTYKNTAVATSDNTDPVKAKNTVKVTKSGVSPKNVIKTVTKGTKDVKTGDVLGLAVLVILVAGIGYLGFTVVKRKKSN